jgi:hypothetical protein
VAFAEAPAKSIPAQCPTAIWLRSASIQSTLSSHAVRQITEVAEGSSETVH